MSASLSLREKAQARDCVMLVLKDTRMGHMIDALLDWLEKKGEPLRQKLAAEPWRERKIHGRRFWTRSGPNRKILID